MIHESFIHNRRQRIILNGQSSNWKFVKAGAKTVIFSYISIINLPQGLLSDVKLFADDASLFSIVNCGKTSATVLNSDLLKSTRLGITMEDIV